MGKVLGRNNVKVRRICRNLYNRANDRHQLQTLVTELQEILREDADDRQVKKYWKNVRVLRNIVSDDPYDKILVT